MKLKHKFGVIEADEDDCRMPCLEAEEAETWEEPEMVVADAAAKSLVQAVV